MAKIKICDFFSGLHSWTKPLQNNGIDHIVFSIDNNPEYESSTTMIDDFLNLTPKMVIDHLGGYPDVIIASPPCTTFSIASCGTHWHPPTNDGIRIPKSQNAVIGLKLLKHTLELIRLLQPQLFYIENPRGLMRKMNCLEGIQRHTIWHCKYGETGGILRAKPTDIWTNSTTWNPKEVCKNHKFVNGVKVSNHCNHVIARRGAKTGTQGMKNNASRSLIPYELCEEIMHDYLTEFYSTLTYEEGV